MLDSILNTLIYQSGLSTYSNEISSSSDILLQQFSSPDFNIYSPFVIDFTNLTVADITGGSKVPQLIQNATSISNSCFFLVVYSVILSLIIYFFAKSAEKMVRNQKIIFTLVFLFVLTHVVPSFSD